MRPGRTSSRPVSRPGDLLACRASMTVIYTYTDEAPALATHSLLPIVEAFAGAAGVDVELRDISLAGRILAQFGLAPDALAELGELATTPAANIVKLPNISASIPQLKAAIRELQDAGYDLPEYEDARERYDRVKGSAVNPVLREGNSDRRAPASVKAFARKHPHSMGAWSPDSATHVARWTTATSARPSARSPWPAAGELRIEHVAADGTVTALKAASPVPGGRDRRRGRDAPRGARRLPRGADRGRARSGVLFSLHLKATMMKVSDPIIFGHAVRAFFADVFARARRRARGGRREPEPRPRERARRARAAAGRPRGGGRAGDRGHLRDGAAPGDGRLGPRHHQPARAERRDHRRLDAGHDPHARGRCGTPTASRRTPRRSSPTRATRRSTRRRSTSAASTAPSTPRRWGRRRTSG